MKSVYANNQISLREQKHFFSLGYWKSLNNAEKLTGATILALPVLWSVGIYLFFPSLLCLGILWHDFKKYGELRLKRPNAVTILVTAFITYRVFGGIFYDIGNNIPVDITALVRGMMIIWYPVILLYWYIDSNDIRVRPAVVGHSFLVLAFSMLAFWGVVELGLGAPDYEYPHTLYSSLSNNAPGPYEAGKGLANYMIPYRTSDASFGPFVRWSFYFIIPELLGLVASYMCLVSLDLKNRLAATLLFSASVFLILLSGTRSCWLVLPIVLLGRTLFVYSKRRSPVIPLAIAALVSFTTLCFPVVTENISDFLLQKSEVVGEVREDSTSVRSEIYRKTIDGLPDKLIQGHWEYGPTVLPGFDLARIGSHSFILGTLLYRTGLIGTLIFLAFWGSLFYWFYTTADGRPLSGLLVLCLYTLLSPVMEFGETIPHLIVLCAAIVRHPSNSEMGSGFSGRGIAKNFMPVER